MDEEAARAALLVKAVEETDRSHALLPPADRARATREAGTPRRGDGDALSAAEAAFLERRARLLLPLVRRAAPDAFAAYEAAGWRSGLSVLLALAAFALGFGLEETGAARRINIVAFPLLGMLAWNVAVYALLAAAALRAGGASGRAEDRGPVLQAVVALLVRTAPRLGLPDAQAPSAAAARAFLGDWRRLAAPLHAARVRRLLHGCAALVALGAIAGLYLRGIAFEYRAGWESTFLDAEAVRALLGVVLAPASAMTGIAVPDAAHIAALRWSAGSGGENAAPWIHLYAATAALFVVLPRLALAAWAWRRERRLRERLPLDAGLARYCRMLLAARGDALLRAALLPYNRTLGAAELRALEAALSEHVGAPVSLDLLPALAYGEEDGETIAALARGREATLFALVCSASAIPEAENQGLVLHALRAARAPHARVLLVVDEGPYRRRLAGQAGADARLAERRSAWLRFGAAHGADVLAVALPAAAAESGANT